MEQYVYKRRTDGVHVINLRRTWEKLLLAARAIAAIEHPAEVFAISSRSFGQRAVLKFSSYTGSTPIAGRFTPGAFTNQVNNIHIYYLLLPMFFFYLTYLLAIITCMTARNSSGIS